VALDRQETRDTLFGRKRVPLNPPEEVVKILPDQMSVKADPISNDNPWEYIERVTVPLRVEQKEGIDRIAKNIMRNRAKGPFHNEGNERITGNTIIRALIDCLLEKESLLISITAKNEEEAKNLVRKALKQ